MTGWIRNWKSRVVDKCVSGWQRMYHRRVTNQGLTREFLEGKADFVPALLLSVFTGFT